MARAATIEERTDLFIAEYERLTKNSELPDNKVLADQLGIKSPSTLSNILGRRQNIKHSAWKAFKEKYGLKEIQKSSEKEDISEPTLNQILMIMAKTMQKIEGKMAQADAQARIEANLKTVVVAVRSLNKRQQAMAAGSYLPQKTKPAKRGTSRDSDKNRNQNDAE